MFARYFLLEMKAAKSWITQTLSNLNNQAQLSEIWMRNLDIKGKGIFLCLGFLYPTVMLFLTKLHWIIIVSFSGTKTTIKIPKRVTKGGIYEHKEFVDNDGSCFSPRSLFALPPDSSSLMLDSFQFMDESSDQDLLLDVPSNNSFPQAELLFPTSSFGAQSSTSSSSIQPQLVRPSKQRFENSTLN